MSVKVVTLTRCVPAFRRLTRSASTMPLKFATNLSFMFKENSNFVDRYNAARDAGFKYVECGFPYDVPLEELTAAKKGAGLEQILINAYPGNLQAGDLGLAALPSRKEEFREKLELSIKYANALDCKRMHVMAGKRGQADDTAMEQMFVENIKYAADRLQKEGILALIEPINTLLSVPGYFLSDPQKGLEYVKKINHPNLKLQLDLFHVQLMTGNLTQNIKDALPYVGHVQIAQVPDRHEPDTPGEINYSYIFTILEDLGYDGYIGLEYNPIGKTADGLDWMKKLSQS